MTTKIGRPRVGEYRNCIDCGCRVYVRKRDINSPTAGQQCRACQRKKGKPFIIREAKQTTPTKAAACGICGYFGNEKLDSEKILCPKCGMGALQPFVLNSEKDD